jgi:primosomal protein N''
VEVVEQEVIEQLFQVQDVMPVLFQFQSQLFQLQLEEVEQVNLGQLEHQPHQDHLQYFQQLQVQVEV